MGAHSVNLQLTVLGDNNIEQDGTITVSIEAADSNSDTYSVAGTYASASVDVRDDDTPPVLSIAGGGGPYTEGTDQNVEFTISSNKNVGTFNVRYRPVAVASNFLAGDIKGTDQEELLNFNNTTTATLRLAIDDDEVVEEDGVVIVQLLSNSSIYTVIADEAMQLAK